MLRTRKLLLHREKREQQSTRKQKSFLCSSYSRVLLMFFLHSKGTFPLLELWRVLTSLSVYSRLWLFSLQIIIIYESYTLVQVQIDTEVEHKTVQLMFIKEPVCPVVAEPNFSWQMHVVELFEGEILEVC